MRTAKTTAKRAKSDFSFYISLSQSLCILSRSHPPLVNILPTVSISSSLNKIEGLRTGYAGDRSSTSTTRLLDFYKANTVNP